MAVTFFAAITANNGASFITNLMTESMKKYDAKHKDHGVTKGMLPLAVYNCVFPLALHSRIYYVNFLNNCKYSQTCVQGPTVGRKNSQAVVDK